MDNPESGGGPLPIFRFPSLRKVAGTAALVLGGVFLLFMLWRLRGYNDHVKLFDEVCSKNALSVNALGKSTLCDEARKYFFRTKAPYFEIDPRLVKAPELPIDHRVRFLAFQNPNLFSAYAYCYSLKRGWLKGQQNITAKDFAMQASGFSILEAELGEYNIWSESKQGIKCIKETEAELGLSVPVLKNEFRGKRSIVAINIAALVRNKANMDGVIQEALLTFNHERIHALQVACKNFQEWSEYEWQDLPVQEKAALEEAYPNYPWGNARIAAREYIAYKYEKDPNPILMHLGKCDL